MNHDVSRRHLLQAAAALGASAGLWPLNAAAGRAKSGTLPAFGPAEPFTFDALKERASTLAATTFKLAVTPDPQILERIDYDAYQQIKFKSSASLKIGQTGETPVQLFHLGRYFKEPVRIHVVEGGESREVRYTSQLFETPGDSPSRELHEGIGFAGLRVMAPDQKTDWLAVLGASYFRSSGPYNQYGLSARGLAIDTGLARPEEFPRFTEFWLEGGEQQQGALTLYALLDSPSIAGAYRIKTERVTDARDIHRVVMEVDAELFARKDIERLGIAPFSSMFWYGEASRKQSADWRPEIHDSDGLAVLTGSGERIWRPINNPPKVMTSTFIDRDPKGFGLLQRDRDFMHYLDDGVFYERRPSVWVEPLDPWGEGFVHLVEIPTDDETFDNIVAFWAPKEQMKTGDARQYRYRLSWLDDVAYPDAVGRATGTWTGMGGRPGHKRPQGVRKFVVDWQGPVFAGLGRADGVELVVTASRGNVSNAYSYPVVDQRERWRSLFDIEASGPEPVDLRAFLRLKDRALTETWIGQYFPDS